MQIDKNLLSSFDNLLIRRKVENPPKNRQRLELGKISDPQNLGPGPEMKNAASVKIDHFKKLPKTAK